MSVAVLFDDPSLVPECLREAADAFGQLGRREDHDKALRELLERYPESKWRPAAETFVRLIDERDALREVSVQDHLLIETTQGEKARALQENDHLKKTVRELTEKLQSETAALPQENEQLKKDIQRLKALEIELEKRERTLR